MRSLPLPEVLSLLDTLPVKYACLAAIGVTTGCRITELLLLQRHDLLNHEGKLKEEIAFVKLKNKKKKNEKEKKVVHRRLAIPPDFHSYVLRHLQEEELMGYDMPNDYVFRGRLGNHLSRCTAYNKFRSILGSGHGTHWMRKTFAQEFFKFLLAESPKDPMRALELTRQTLDHARLDTTVKYLGINEESRTRAQNTIFNRERILNGTSNKRV
jgi:integrase